MRINGVNMRAMLLAAGLGMRLRPLTQHVPKPLISIAGATMIDRMLDHLVDAGITDVVINTHHLGDQIKQHVATRAKPNISILHETKLLDTGGAVRHALSLIGGSTFQVLNSDVIMLNGVEPFLTRMMDTWRSHMKALLLLYPTVRAFGYNGLGDFNIEPDGKIRRRVERELAPYLFTGVQILDRELFEDCPITPFSLNRIYDAAQETGHLFGVVHDGEWMHVGTMDAMARIENHLKLLS